MIGLEIDKKLYDHLNVKFSNQPNIKLYNCDFLSFKIPDQEYKIFGNIPFNITTDIIRKILNQCYPPEEAYLIMEKGALDDIVLVPNPFQYDAEKQIITFYRVPEDTEIEIFNIFGNKIKDIRPGRAGEDIEWDVRDEHGNKLIRGLYMARIQDENGEKRIIKFMVK